MNAMLEYFIAKKKVKVFELERLAGYLNFLNKAVVPGRTFTRRMYAKFANLGLKSLEKIGVKGSFKHYYKIRKFHHVRLDNEFKNDCKIWIQFLYHINAVCRPYVDLAVTRKAEILTLTTDASKGIRLGFGAYFFLDWLFGQWEFGYIEQMDPSIEYLELYAVLVAIYAWSHRLCNGRFVIWCDNSAVCGMIKKGSTGCRNCSHLLRMLTLSNLIHNRKIFAEHITTEDNFLSDHLSRLRVEKFKKEAPEGIHSYPTHLPIELCPPSRVWLK